MPSPILITRSCHTPEGLHQQADKCKDLRQARRMRVVAIVLDGHDREAVVPAQGTMVRSIRRLAALNQRIQRGRFCEYAALQLSVPADARTGSRGPGVGGGPTGPRDDRARLLAAP